jgi:hypothetical protein
MSIWKVSLCNLASFVLCPTERILCSGGNIQGTSEHYRWTECQAESVSSVNRMSSRIFYHPWSECQQNSIIREHNVKQNLYPIIKKKPCLNIPVRGVLEHWATIRTKPSKTHNSPYPCLRYTSRHCSFRCTSASLHVWRNTYTSYLFRPVPQSSQHVPRYCVMCASARWISITLLYNNRNYIRNASQCVRL